jgi:hypothetical protein
MKFNVYIRETYDEQPSLPTPSILHGFPGINPGCGGTTSGGGGSITITGGRGGRSAKHYFYRDLDSRYVHSFDLLLDGTFVLEPSSREGCLGIKDVSGTVYNKAGFTNVFSNSYSPPFTVRLSYGFTAHIHGPDDVPTNDPTLVGPFTIDEQMALALDPATSTQEIDRLIVAPYVPVRLKALANPMASFQVLANMSYSYPREVAQNPAVALALLSDPSLEEMLSEKTCLALGLEP